MGAGLAPATLHKIGKRQPNDAAKNNRRLKGASGEGIFDRKDCSPIRIRPPTPQKAAGNALAVAVPDWKRSAQVKFSSAAGQAPF
jgi:hypothetical protein